MDDQPIESTDKEQIGGPGARVFVGIAGLVLVVGLSIGGAFGIGVQVGQSQTEDVEEVPPLAITAEEPGAVPESDEDADTEIVTFGPGDGEIPPEAIQQMRAQGATEADIAAIRTQFRQFQRGEGAGFPQGRPGFLAGTGDTDNGEIGTRMNGTIESIDGNTITLMTPTGLQRISTISGTRITVTQSGEIDDLGIGDRVTVAVVPGPEEDVLEAASITAISADE
ncbi:MAG: hypothetical protein F4X20_00215 [Dehalococcoidia bacterium]|nr:hypothetical protein [Dehalococcoidia bacterium]